MKIEEIFFKALICEISETRNITRKQTATQNSSMAKGAA